MSEAPNRTYYQAVHGRWRCPFAFAITDWSAFRRCRLRTMDRLRVLSIALVPKLLGRLVLDTSVDAKTNPREVVHTTRLSKWGMTVFRSVEVLTLDDNGRDLTMRMVQRLWPALWREMDGGEARGRIDETGTHASYEIPWLGTRMLQTGERDADGVRLVQETSFSRGVQELRRVT